MAMSLEQQNIIKNIKNEKRLVLLIQFSIIITFIITWELLTKYNIINAFIYSSPSKIFITIKDLFISGNLLFHIYTTCYETFIAFTLGITLSFIIAIILYSFKILGKIFEPFLTMINSLPKVALGPLIIILVGANTKSIIVMALLINLIVNILTIYTGFTTVDKDKIKLLQSFHAKKFQILTKLIIPSSYKIIISSLKLNISMTLIGVIMGEFLTSKAGIGYLILYGSQVFNLNLVMSGIILLLILSIILYKLISLIEKKLLNSHV